MEPRDSAKNLPSTPTTPGFVHPSSPSGASSAPPQDRAAQHPKLKPPHRLLLSATLTSAERRDLQVAARTAYSTITSLEFEPTVRKFTAAFDVDPAAAAQLVRAIAQHARPVPHQQQPCPAAWRGNLLMMTALLAPFLLARLIFLAARVGRNEALLVFVVAALLYFPLLRSALTKKAIMWRRRNAPDGLAQLVADRRDPVLYLRSHSVDGSSRDSDSYRDHYFMRTDMKTLEERIAAALRVVGPVVALEGPDEGSPHLGAARIRVDDVERDKWQLLVQGLISRSALVAVRFRPTAGMYWEVDQLLRLYPPNQLVFVLSEPRGDLKERDHAWDRLRPILQHCAQGLLPDTLGPHDYCLGFDAEFRPRIFGKRNLLFGKDAAFMDALVKSALWGNPGLDDLEYRLHIAAVAAG